MSQPIRPRFPQVCVSLSPTKAQEKKPSHSQSSEFDVTTEDCETFCKKFELSFFNLTFNPTDKDFKILRKLLENDKFTFNSLQLHAFAYTFISYSYQDIPKEIVDLFVLKYQDFIRKQTIEINSSSVSLFSFLLAKYPSIAEEVLPNHEELIEFTFIRYLIEEKRPKEWIRVRITDKNILKIYPKDVLLDINFNKLREHIKNEHLDFWILGKDSDELRLFDCSSPIKKVQNTFAQHVSKRDSVLAEKIAQILEVNYLDRSLALNKTTHFAIPPSTHAIVFVHMVLEYLDKRNGIFEIAEKFKLCPDEFILQFLRSSIIWCNSFKGLESIKNDIIKYKFPGKNSDLVSRLCEFILEKQQSLPKVPAENESLILNSESSKI